jgi:hypothetical protein
VAKVSARAPFRSSPLLICGSALSVQLLQANRRYHNFASDLPESFVRRDKPSAGILLYLDRHNQAHTAQHTIAKVRYVHLTIFVILMTLVTVNKSW